MDATAARGGVRTWNHREGTMILVVGATGHLGSVVCEQLAKHGRPIRALVRATSKPDSLERLRGLGAELVEGDLQDRASLDAACVGVDAVISSASSISSRVGSYIATVDLEGQRNLIAAASGAGVGRFVFVSFSSNLITDSPLNRAKRTIESEVRASGLGYTILRSSFFMEYWLSPLIGVDYPNRKATLFGAGENPISWITIRDVAEAAAIAADAPAAKDQVIDIGGPAALSPNEALRLFEDVIGARFELSYVPEAALEAQMADTDDPHTQSITALSLDFAHGDVVDTTNMTARLPFERSTVRRYIEALPDR
jgi:uncharacterized protein YbjT (DUF2867 family)